MYHEVYWYVKEPGDFSAFGTLVETDTGDGGAKHATMTYNKFLAEDDDPDSTVAYYEITAYVYKWDLSVYWDSYLIWVPDLRVNP